MTLKESRLRSQLKVLRGKLREVVYNSPGYWAIKGKIKKVEKDIEDLAWQEYLSK